MAGSLLPEPKQQFLNDIGVPLFGGKIYTYAAGTLTPKATYQDRDLTILNTNPIVANARGEVVMYGSGNYRVILKDLFDVTIWDRDNVETPDVAAATLASNLTGSGGASLVGYLPPGATIASTVKAQLDKEFFASNYTSFQAAHDACAAAGGGTLWVDGSFVISTAFQWDINKVFVQGTHPALSRLDFRTMPGPSSPDVDLFAFEWRNPTATRARKGMANLTILGPLASVGVSCFPLFSSVTDAITNLSFEGVTILDFESQLFFGSQCSNVNFYNCFFRNTDGSAFRTTTVIKTAAAAISNGGECWTFSQCQFGNVNKVVENNTGIAGGWQFDQCALVYFNSLFDLRSPCRISMSQGHVESDSYVNNWISAKGNGCTVRANQVEFWFSGNIVKEPFYCDTDVIFGGIVIRDCDYHSTQGATIRYWSNRIGGGPIYVQGWSAQDSNLRIPFGMNPGIQLEAWRASSVNFATGFLAESGDASVVAISAAQPFDDGTGNTNVTQLGTTLAGQLIRRYRRYPVKSGQNIEASIFLKSTGFTTDGSGFGVYVTIFDMNGVAIGGGNPFNSVGDTANYTKINLSWYPSAPVGAAFYEFRIFAGAATGNNPRSIYLAEMVINAY